MAGAKELTLEQVIRQLRDKPNPERHHYVSACALAEVAPPTQLPSGEGFRGLEAFHLVQGPGEQWWVICYWDSQEAYQREGKRLHSTLGAERVLLHGWLRSFQPRREPLWRRIKLGTMVLSLAAFLGAVEVIRNHYDWLFEVPSLSLEIAGAPTFRYVEGSEWREVVRVWNLTPVTHELIEVEAASLAQGEGGVDPTPLAATPTEIRELRPGSYKEITVTGVSPQAGHFELEVRISAKAGLIPPRKAFPLHRPVEVWPSHPMIANFELADLKRLAEGVEIATLQGVLKTGVPAADDIECELQAEGFRDLRFRLLAYPGAHGERSMSNQDVPGREVFLLTWQGPPLKSFSPVAFQLVLQGPAGTDWERLASEAQGRCP